MDALSLYCRLVGQWTWNNEAINFFFTVHIYIIIIIINQ